MFTQCPACQTVYRLRLDQLRAARGQVRCSRCDTIFDALDHRVSQESPTPVPAQQPPQLDHTAGAAALAGAATAYSASAPAESPIETESSPTIEPHAEADAESPADGPSASSDAETIASPTDDNPSASSFSDALDLAELSPTGTSAADGDEPIEEPFEELIEEPIEETIEEPIADLPQALELADTTEIASDASGMDAGAEDFPAVLDLAELPPTGASAADGDEPFEELIEEAIEETIEEPTADLPQALELADTTESASDASDMDAGAEDFPAVLDLAELPPTGASAADGDESIEEPIEEPIEETIEEPIADLPQALELADTTESTSDASDMGAGLEDFPEVLDLAELPPTGASATDGDEPIEEPIEESIEETIEEPIEDLPQALDLDNAQQTWSLDEANGSALDDSEPTTVAEQAPLFSEGEISEPDSPLEVTPLEAGEDESPGVWDDLASSPTPDHLGEALQAFDLDNPEASLEETTDNAPDDAWDHAAFEADSGDVGSIEEDPLSPGFAGLDDPLPQQTGDDSATQNASPEAEATSPDPWIDTELTPADTLADEEAREEASSELPGISTHPDADLLEEDFASLWDSALDTELAPEDAESVAPDPDAVATPSDRPADENKGWDDFSEQHIESLLTPAEGGELPEIAIDEDNDVVMHTELHGADEALDLASFSSDDDSNLNVDDFEFEHHASQPDAHRERDPDEILLKQLLPEEDLDLDVPAPEDVVTTTPVPPQSPPPSARQAASYHIEPEPAPRRGSRGFSTLLWAGGILLMLATLVGQFAYYHQGSLASHPQLRPLLAQLCHFTECELPPQRDLSKIRLASHLVQFHPRHQDSLLITATLINRADFAQPYPDVALHMTDLQQQVVASRRFSPQEYLVGQRSDRPMPQNIEIPLMLEVLDPGREVVGFRFEFY